MDRNSLYSLRGSAVSLRLLWSTRAVLERMEVRREGPRHAGQPTTSNAMGDADLGHGEST